MKRPDSRARLLRWPALLAGAGFLTAWLALGAPGCDGGGVTPTAVAVCTPGIAQTCVGPGACKGGQFCLEDGTAWSACDCRGAGASGTGGVSGAGGVMTLPGGTGGLIVSNGTGGTPGTGGAASGDGGASG